MSELFLKIIKQIVAAIAAMLTPEQVKSVLDKAFDAVEKEVAASKTKWDDVIILPILQALRHALDIDQSPYTDDGPEDFTMLL